MAGFAARGAKARLPSQGFLGVGRRLYCRAERPVGGVLREKRNRRHRHFPFPLERHLNHQIERHFLLEV